MEKRTVVRVGAEDFSVEEESRRMRENFAAGAIVSFIGSVRSVNEGRSVDSMTLEHYPAMTEKSLEKIIEAARSKWDLIDVVVIHRVGELALGEQIVLAMVSSAHRQEAFAACEFIMDWLKTRAPFWKKEKTKDGDVWVDARESDEEAVDRWGAFGGRNA